LHKPAISAGDPRHTQFHLSAPKVADRLESQTPCFGL